MKKGISSKRVLLPGGIAPAMLVIEERKIIGTAGIGYEADFPVVDFGDCIVMPALTDTHVHINEPGRTSWEGFETATKAAAAGGITTLVDMPLNSDPVTVNKDALDLKIASASGKIFTDCGFYGGVIPGNADNLESLARAGVLGFKAFMVHSGIDEFPGSDVETLRNALGRLREFTDVPLLVHAESECETEECGIDDRSSYNRFLASRPHQWECRAIESLIKLSKEFDYHVHIVHLSSAHALDMIRRAKSDGIKLTVETCPHYLFFESEKIPDGDTRFKCTPPIRDSANRDLLWNALNDGTIDFIASDHSPCTADLKRLDERDFDAAWGGISSLQISLPAVLTEAKRRGVSIEKISKLMSERTADFAGLGNRKGKLQKGFDADIAVLDDESSFVVDPEKLFHKNKITPYEGAELFGKIESVFLRGEKIFGESAIHGKPDGRIVLKNVL